MAQIKGINGDVADVDNENRLQVFSVSQNEDKHLNTQDKYWSVHFQVTPTAANDLFFYLKNTGTKDLYITDVRISSTVPTMVYYRQVSGTASAGTAATITPRNLGNPSTPTATIEYSVDFTGLTSGGILFFEECATADTMYSLKTSSNIIIPQGQAIAFERIEATGQIECVVSVAEQE